MKRAWEQAIADLRAARVAAWAATGHPDPERALLEDEHRSAYRALGLPRTRAEDRAIVAVMAENEGLIRRFTHAYARTRPELLDDIRQEARIGLLRAVERYDHREGVAFSTVAHWWIRQAIVRYLKNYGDPIRVPVGLHTVKNKVARDRQRHPGATPDQTAKRTGLTIAEIRRSDDLPEQPIPFPRQSGNQNGNETSRIDWSAKDPASAYADLDLTNPDDPDMPELIQLTQAAMFIERAMSCCSDRERYIYRRLIQDGETYVQVGRELGVSRERVRQVKNGIMDLIRQAVKRESGGSLTIGAVL